MTTATKKRKRATVRVISKLMLPASADQSGRAVIVLRELQAQRIAVVRAQVRINNASHSLARRVLGWQVDLAEADRETINTAAGKLVDAIEAGEAVPADQSHAAEVLTPFVASSAAARAPFDAHRKQLEKSMRQAAESLPVWAWAERVKGFGSLGLAIIVGEAGDLSMYANPGKLWKRMGLAVFDGKSQRRVSEPEAAAMQGYNPRRRSAMFTLGDSLMKGNDGEYRKLYDDRKAYERERAPDMSKMHSHRRAQRYMEKRLLRDLWSAWRSVS